MKEKERGSEKMEAIVSLCKRRGFVFPSSEIYGGLGSTWDYGPYGTILKQNVKAAWWKTNVQERDDMVGLDAAILMHPDVWVASGHVKSFADPLVDCKECKQRFRADDLETEVCPECGGELTEARMFNLMFKTFMGPVEDNAAVVFIRPETAQGIFVNFKNVLNTSRKKPPFGIAQIGKAFRNEITPGKFTFRTREFEQMEIEYFTPPDEAEKWFDYWYKERLDWYKRCGMKEENIRLRRHDKDELAHYAADCYDVEYNFPFGWAELEGIANRTDYDLRCHQVSSGKDIAFFDEANNTRYLPYIIEPSAGADRATLAFLIDAYDEDEAPDEKGVMEKRVVLRFAKKLAPIKAAVLPLFKKAPLAELAHKIHADIRPHYMSEYDQTGSIGKRYRRQDEIGTPYCITIDYQSLEDNQVTIRDRDSMKQDRIPIDEILPYLKEKLASPCE
ncbi:MAG: glycine--tRNA ligase [Chloroflexi bacterium]|nr:glycine--tRNA ligase [Chloroflexota bacterium]